MTNSWERWEWHSLRAPFHGIMGGLHRWCCVVSHDTALGLATCFSCWCAILGGYIISAEVRRWRVGWAVWCRVQNAEPCKRSEGVVGSPGTLPPSPVPGYTTGPVLAPCGIDGMMERGLINEVSPLTRRR